MQIHRLIPGGGILTMTVLLILKSNIQHISINEPGIYSVKLIVSTSSQTDSLTRIDFIVVNQLSRITSGPVAKDDGNSRGSSWGDFDNDGDLDLFVANLEGNNFLYRNDREAGFIKITSGPVVNDGGGSTGSSWGDYDNDGNLDLFVANSGFNENNFLYRNDGSGRFIKIINGSVVNNGGSSSGSSWGDYDNDGDLDLFVANSGKNFLYRNDQSAGFVKITNGPGGQ